jgi:hypothetical protein
VIQIAFRHTCTNAETETVTTADAVFQNLEYHQEILKLRECVNWINLAQYSIQWQCFRRRVIAV